MTRKMKDSGVEWIGEIPEEWKVRKLRRYAYLKTGSTPSTKNKEVFEGDFNWFTPSDFNESLILNKSSRNLNKSFIKENIAPIFPLNCILIVGIGATVGKLGFTTGESSSNQQITAIIPKKCINPKYLLYMMLASIDVIKDTALFTTLPILNNQTLGNTIILILSKDEQTQIANYLDTKCTTIDQTIEKQKQVIEKLKEYKQSIITEAVTKGLNPDVKMKDSGIEWIGEIPEEWKVCKLKYCCEIIMGQSPSSNNYNMEGIGEPFLQGNADFTELYPNERVYTKKANKFVQTNDILLSVRAPVGAKNLANKRYAIGRGLCALRVNNINNKLLWYFINIINKEFDVKSKGSTYDSITISDVMNAAIVIGNIQEQKQISNYLDKKCTTIDKAICKKQELIKKLTEYKKSLIYECVTGKKEV